MMKIKDIRKKSEKDLIKEETRLREALAKTQVDRYTTEDKNNKKTRGMRRDLARVLTVLNEEVEASTDEDANDNKKEDK